jgi:hypothetical protein
LQLLDILKTATLTIRDEYFPAGAANTRANCSISVGAAVGHPQNKAHQSEKSTSLPEKQIRAQIALSLF